VSHLPAATTEEAEDIFAREWFKWCLTDEGLSLVAEYFEAVKEENN
jgi:hypothetical protein